MVNSKIETLKTAGSTRSFFSQFADKVSKLCGRPQAFISAAIVIVVWALCGPVFDYSDTWQLIINTGTTIITFLMVFIIQNTQNKDTMAMQLKIDELIRATDGAHNALLNLEQLSPEELEKICVHYTKLAQKAQRALRKGETDTNKPDVDVDFGIDA